LSATDVKHGKFLLHEVIERCSRLSIPAQAVLELTYRCNLRCSHCYVDIKDTEELTAEAWKGVIDQMKAEGTIYLLITGGEIMLRDDFLEIATYARRSGFILGFLTNCTLVTPDLAREIADLKPFSIATNLYVATASTHDAITRVPGSYAKTLHGIKLLVECGLTPLVQTLAMKSNLAELPRIKSLVASLGARSSIDTGIVPTRSGADSPFQHEPSVEEMMKCGWRPDAPAADQCQARSLCKAGKGMCSVSPGGDVFPCLMFPLKLGNLKQSKFETIWRLEPCAELRYLRSMRRTDLACATCYLAAYCQRCTGVAYLESGHPDAPSPSACRQALTRWRLNQGAGAIQ
jgi:radical SAM protein with 4Fe4S-binding SPASM domain